MKYPAGVGRHEETKSILHEEIMKRGGAVKKSLHKRLGIIDSNGEEHRVRVWQVNSALVALQKDKHIIRTVENGREYYYAVSE